MEIDLPVDLLMKVLERFLLFGAGIVPSPCWIKKVFSDVDGIVDKVSTFRFECCITCHYLTFHTVDSFKVLNRSFPKSHF